MKVLIVLAAVCIAASITVEGKYAHEAAKHGSAKSYGKEAEYGYESRGKSSSDYLGDDYSEKKMYGKKNSYGEKEEYGFESRDKSSDYHGDDNGEKKAYGSKQKYGKEEKYSYESRDISFHSNNDYKPGVHDNGKSYIGNDDYKHDAGYGKSMAYRQGVAYNKQYVYHGKYNGVCDKDGFYYRDFSSFVICSNSNAYVQPCAPGSRNSGHDAYNYGGNYYYRDFCDVNLVDHGYGVKHGYHGDRYSNEHSNAYGRHDDTYGSYGGYHGDYRAPVYKPYGY